MSSVLLNPLIVFYNEFQNNLKIEINKNKELREYWKSKEFKLKENKYLKSFYDSKNEENGIVKCLRNNIFNKIDNYLINNDYNQSYLFEKNNKMESKKKNNCMDYKNYMNYMNSIIKDPNYFKLFPFTYLNNIIRSYNDFKKLNYICEVKIPKLLQKLFDYELFTPSNSINDTINNSTNNSTNDTINNSINNSINDTINDTINNSINIDKKINIDEEINMEALSSLKKFRFDILKNCKNLKEKFIKIKEIRDIEVGKIEMKNSYKNISIDFEISCIILGKNKNRSKNRSKNNEEYSLSYFKNEDGLLDDLCSEVVNYGCNINFRRKNNEFIPYSFNFNKF